MIEELRAGRVDAYQAASTDDGIAITLRILRAAREGTARLNLRLLAKVVAGQAQRDALVADEFLPYADMLASLSREEIILIATLYLNWTKAAESQKPESSTETSTAWLRTRNELGSGIFPSKDYVEAVASRARRSGLIVQAETWDAPHEISPIMIELATLIDFQDALRKEASL